MAKKKRNTFNIMVSSTVRGNESDLIQISAVLRQKYGYKVTMSKEGRLYVSMGNINNTREACLQAVRDCHFFFGIIYLRYGSGITHDEFKEAIILNKPRLFAANEKVEFLYQVLYPKLYSSNGTRKRFSIPKTDALDDIKVLDMYHEANKTNWVFGFNNIAEILTYIDTQFSNIEKRMLELETLNDQN
ncbi:MAG: DUF4062 domain-containing protein [Brumimicrobium sp.]|nr:DUF4062 domain-containing protein [Brumimicrobium sp.]